MITLSMIDNTEVEMCTVQAEAPPQMLNLAEAAVHAVILDALCWWTTEISVDGFRFVDAISMLKTWDGGIMSRAPLVEAIARHQRCLLNSKYYIPKDVILLVVVIHK